MRYTVDLTRSAKKDVLTLDDETYERVSVAISALRREPRPTNARKLKGREDAWRIRIGEYRIVYTVDDAQRTVSVFRVKHRREVCRT